MFVMRTPVITADRVITVPIERSMPPLMITNVTPRARTPLTAVASRMPMTLLNWRKFGDATENTTIMTISAPNASSRWIASDRNTASDRDRVEFIRRPPVVAWRSP